MVYALAVSLFFQSGRNVLLAEKFIYNSLENDIETLNQKILLAFLLDVHALGIIKEIVA